MDKRYLYKENIIKKIGGGYESDVYLYNENRKKVVLKLFKDSKSLDNKELKLILLREEKLILDEMKLYHRIYDKEKGFVGYTSEYVPSIPLMEYMYKNKKKRVSLLAQIEEKYQALNEKGIFIGDFTIENFGVNNGKIKFYDIDNYSINDLDFDAESIFMLKYFDRCTKKENIDYYCFNMFTLSFLINVIEPCTINYIRRFGLPKEFKTEECEKLYRDLLLITDDYKREKLVDGSDKTLLKCMKKGLFK